MLEPYEGAFGAGARHRHPVRRRRGAPRGRRPARRARVPGAPARAGGPRRSEAPSTRSQAARDANGPNDARHHLAHIQLPDPADVPRLRPLGVVANMQPFWAAPDPMIESDDAPARRGSGPRTCTRSPTLRAPAPSCASAATGRSPRRTRGRRWRSRSHARCRASPMASVLDAAQRIDLRHRDRGVHARQRLREPRRRRGFDRGRQARRSRGPRSQPVRRARAPRSRRTAATVDDRGGPRRPRRRRLGIAEGAGVRRTRPQRSCAASNSGDGA